jgi:translation elongation factor EF-Tu-like GTPase
MVREHSFIEAEVVLLAKDEGGRSNPVLPVAYGGGLRPHIVLQDRSVRTPKIGVRDGQKNWILDDYISVAFWAGPDPVPISTPFTLTMILWCHPNPIYDDCIPGVTFTIREGGKIIGHGEIKRRWVHAHEEKTA